MSNNSPNSTPEPPNDRIVVPALLIIGIVGTVAITLWANNPIAVLAVFIVVTVTITFFLTGAMPRDGRFGLIWPVIQLAFISVIVYYFGAG